MGAASRRDPVLDTARHRARRTLQALLVLTVSAGLSVIRLSGATWGQIIMVLGGAALVSFALLMLIALHPPPEAREP